MRVRYWALALVVAVGAGSIGTHRAIHRPGKMSTPNGHLLFNGWGISPVGVQLRIGDMPLKLVVSPDGHQLVTTTLGFKGAHLTTVDTEARKVIQTLDFERVWNGLAFSPDGKTLYMSGGNSGKLIAFSYDAGHLTKLNEIKGPDNSFISGIAVHPSTG